MQGTISNFAFFLQVNCSKVYSRSLHSHSLQILGKRKEDLLNLLFFVDFAFFIEYNKDIER